jgi:hypothetical protein
VVDGVHATVTWPRGQLRNASEQKGVHGGRSNHSWSTREVCPDQGAAPPHKGYPRLRCTRNNESTRACPYVQSRAQGRAVHAALIKRQFIQFVQVVSKGNLVWVCQKCAHESCSVRDSSWYGREKGGVAVAHGGIGGTLQGHVQLILEVVAPAARANALGACRARRARLYAPMVDGKVVPATHAETHEASVLGRCKCVQRWGWRR